LLAQPFSTHAAAMRLALLLIGTFWGLWAHPLMAQVDSTASMPDTSVIDTPPAPAELADSLIIPTPIPGKSGFGLIDSTGGRSAIPPWLRENPKRPTGPIAKVRDALADYQAEYGPQIYERADGKIRLYLRFPKRDSIVLPFPKGLLRTPLPPPYDPAIAWQRSAIFPGLGQAYTGGYWKIPLWWSGYAAIGWWLDFNQQQYRLFGDAYFCLAVEGGAGCTIPPALEGVDASGLRTQRNQFRQRRDNAILWLVAWHSLQVIEAFVAAHLKGFDVSDDLTLKLSPAQPVPGSLSAMPGVGIGLQF